MKSFEQWIAAFNKKVPEGFQRDERFTLFYLPDKGLCELAATEKMMIVGNVSGDGRFWKKFAEKLARKFGLKVGGTTLARTAFPAWARLLDYKVIKVDEQNGLKRYQGINPNGNWLIMTEHIVEGGALRAHATWEIPDNEI